MTKTKTITPAANAKKPQAAQPQARQPQARSPQAKSPLATLHWVHRDTLRANHYNPNHVAPPEMALLKVSIMEDGWTQPIVCLPDYTIVDGFHRYTVAGDPDVFALTDGFVPVVIIEADATHRMMSTVRHNRARGQHGVLKMAEIVVTMLNDNVPVEEICRRLGMEEEEIERLAVREGIPLRMKDAEFHKSWGVKFDKNT